MYTYNWYSAIKARAATANNRSGFFHAKKEMVTVMPRKPKRPCGHMGCPNLTDGQFCDTHKKQEAREYNTYRRDPESNKKYGRRWKQIRARVIQENPLCEECLKDGRYTPAEQVHHVKPLSEGGTHDAGNLMALCSSCHSGITLGENNRRRGVGR